MPPGSSLTVPRLARIGYMVILAAVMADLTSLALAWSSVEPAATAASTGHHAVPFDPFVLLGMVLLLAGVVADAVRTTRGRAMRPERIDRHALR